MISTPISVAQLSHPPALQLDSFIHLHLGIDASNLPKDLECHHLIINDLYTDLPAPHNVCIVSIPTGGRVKKK
jgi:hypothetical protein